MMKASSVSCPDCGGATDSLGPIPATNVFAGRTLGRPLPGGWLFRCRQCALGFRWPRLPKEELDALYIQGNEATWMAAPESRRDWRIARGWLAEPLAEGDSILDVGCFDGGFLESLVGRFRCYGIEIHPVARKRAESKGIEIIGSDFSAVSGSFDCVTAFDVIEHVEQPRVFLQDCLAAVRPGGVVVIATGNLDAPTFRWMGSRYWYCTIAEHICFLSPAWFAGLTGSLGYRVLRQTTFAHGSNSLLWHVRGAASNLLYWLLPSVFKALRRWGVGGKDPRAYPELADHPPGWGSAKDHFIVLLEKQ